MRATALLAGVGAAAVLATAVPSASATGGPNDAPGRHAWTLRVGGASSAQVGNRDQTSTNGGSSCGPVLVADGVEVPPALVVSPGNRTATVDLRTSSEPQTASVSLLAPDWSKGRQLAGSSVTVAATPDGESWQVSFPVSLMPAADRDVVVEVSWPGACGPLLSYVFEIWSNGDPVIAANPTAAPSLTAGPRLDVYRNLYGSPSPVSAQVGNRLACRVAYSGAATKVRIAWLRDGTSVAGASGSNYRLRPADAGHRISCRTMATNAFGRTKATASGASRRIFARPE